MSLWDATISRSNRQQTADSNVLSAMKTSTTLRLHAGIRWLATRRSVPYSEHQTSLGRPLSPAVTVYKQPIPAMSSIANRVTGILLTVGFAGIGVVAAAGYDVPAAIGYAQDRVPGFELGAKFLVAFPLAVHGLSGARHLMWDHTPEKITYPYAVHSSKVLAASSLAVAVAATAVTIHSPVPRRR